jgi:DNA-binding response OmpR family regulator/flavodoxin
MPCAKNILQDKNVAPINHHHQEGPMETAPKIIVVDDEKSICNNVEKILKKNHYEVVHAVSADDALEKMALESFSLLISDIVMPGKNGLELLKLVKKQWPLTKTVMMTAYASTDTAVKAIRMGALDYIPKPFTPDELRSTVEKALTGELTEAPTTPEEREVIDAIDLDIPFDANEVAAVTGEAYAKTLGPSDMPVIEVKMPEPLEGFCETGNMVCDIFKKLGATCKAGTKTQTCPQLAKKKRTAKKKDRTDVKQLIGIDQPFDYEEVAAVTGPEYVNSLQSDGVAFLPYEELKKNVSRMMQRGKIDVDIPFDRDEVAQQTGEAYADQISRSDIPVIEITASESVEGFCEVGSMVCDIFKKLGATCKAGTKTAKCPQLAKKKRAAKKGANIDMKELIGIDQPFNYDEVAAVTGPEYIQHLVYDGVVQVPYETLKQNVARMTREIQRPSATALSFPKESVTKNILVIDDEVAVNNNIRKILLKKGYQVDQAITKEEALESISSHPYTLILLDLKIPGVKGLELLQMIREKNPQARVIMITGYASIETAVEAARMGAVDYLPKPFTPDEIREATDKAFLLAA